MARIPPPDLTDEPEDVRLAVYSVVIFARSAEERIQALRAVSPDIRDCVSDLVVYDLACQVALAPGGQDARRAALARVPETIRSRVEQEARRLFALRAG